MTIFERIKEGPSALASKIPVLSSFLLLLALSLYAAPAHAGSVTNLRTHDEYRGFNALQDAVNNAETGDTLFIDGTVFGNTTITGSGSLSSLTLLGNDFKATLDGDQNDRVLDISGYITVTIENLIIQNGYTSGNGAGINSYNGANVYLDDSEVSYNTSTSGNGGGIYSGNTGSLSLHDTKVYHNSAYSFGGGIYFEGPSLEINESKIKHNEASGYYHASGGGLYIETTPTSASIYDTEISFNSATFHGGGIENTNNSSTTLSGVEITNNTASEGAGVHNDGGSVLSIYYSFIGNNTASGNGGGAFNDGSGGTLNVTESTIIHNTASSGGGIFNNVGGTLTLTDTTVIHNTPDDIQDL